jgi:hypothetical protein
VRSPGPDACDSLLGEDVIGTFPMEGLIVSGIRVIGELDFPPGVMEFGAMDDDPNKGFGAIVMGALESTPGISVFGAVEVMGKLGAPVDEPTGVGTAGEKDDGDSVVTDELSVTESENVE